MNMYSIRHINPATFTTVGRNLRTRRWTGFAWAGGQHTKAFHTSLDVQRGFLVGVSHKKWEFTT